ncbi:MAG: DUF4743 domain-containing protein [Rubrivivax sp.]|nr:DUF4743 domain-containing protein [Rubrivivax sp.]
MTRWRALREATRAERPRVPFAVAGREVGSVAIGHLDALRAIGGDLHVDAHRVALDARDATAALAGINQRLRDAGLILAWRDETIALPDPLDGSALATMERAAARFWGTLTLGAHANGYVADAAGRPTHLWIARRSPSKATDPGRLDNMIGGGVPLGQSPRETLVREGFEEAGLAPQELQAARAGRVLRLARDIPEGFQHEWLHAFDVELPAGRVPVNQDGEVAGFELLALDDALAVVDEMTVDAALVTLDFAVRHGLVDDAALHEGLRRLQVPVRP